MCYVQWILWWNSKMGFLFSNCWITDVIMFYLVLSREGSWKDNCEEKFFRNLLSICLVIRNYFVCGVGRVAIASLLLLLPTILGHSACRIFPLLSYFCQKHDELQMQLKTFLWQPILCCRKHDKWTKIRGDTTSFVNAFYWQT